MANKDKKTADNTELQKSPRNGKKHPSSPFPFSLISFLLPQLGPFSSAANQGLPPGPSLLHLIRGYSRYAVRSLPYHQALGELASTYGPLMHFKLGEIPLFVVSSPDMAKEVFRNHDLATADRPRTMSIGILSYNQSDLVFSPHGPYWKEMRKVCNSELLGPKSTRSFEHIRKDEAAVLIRSIESTRGSPFNLTEEIAVCTGNVTSRVLYGKMWEGKGGVTIASRKDPIDPKDIAKTVEKAMAYVGSYHLADFFPSIGLLKFFSWNNYAMQKLKRHADELLDYVIAEHRRNRALTGKGYGDGGGEDFVDVLLRMQENHQLDISITDDNIKGVISDMIVGAAETVSSAIDWAMVELIRNPNVMVKAQNEIRQIFKGRENFEESEIQTLKYLKMVVKETLRIHPPNCVIPRTCREEFELDGYRIPLNATIILNIWAVARDPDYWPNPERFEPERFEGNSVEFRGNHFEYLPFGAGKRICPGIVFGMANVEFLLAQLLYHFDWKLPQGMSPDEMDMAESGGAIVSRKNNLYLIATRYDPATVDNGNSKLE